MTSVPQFLKPGTFFHDKHNLSAKLKRRYPEISFYSESGFICLELVKKSSSVITTRMGRLSRNPDEACDQSLFFDKSTQSTVLVSKCQTVNQI